MIQNAQEDHDSRPQIKIEDGELPQQIDEAIAALVAVAPREHLVIYGERLACIRVNERDETGIVARPAGAAHICYPDAFLVAELLTSAARWVRYDRRLEAFRDTNAPMRFAHHVLSRGDWPELPRCSGIVESPTFWRGEIIDRPGLHAASGLFLTARPKGYRTPPLHPTANDVESALEYLLESVSTFAFSSAADRTAAVAGIMTAVLRRALPSAPVICIDANLPASGKSLLARVMSAIAIGRAGSVIAFSGVADEDEKRVGAALVAGDSIVIADNVEGELNSPLLCIMVTEQEVSIRVLGQGRNVKVPTNLTFIATGNNLQVVRDMRRRVLLTRLNAGVERPEERTFGRDAVSHVLERRGALVRSVLTLTLAYHQAGHPHVGLKPNGGFQDWDLAVRRPLVWMGQPDPLEPSEGLRDVDPDVQCTRALFSAWRESFGPNGSTVNNALRTARKLNHRFDGDDDLKHPELRDAMQMAVGDKLESRALGRWMRRHKDRIIDELELHQEEDLHAGVARWAVRKRGVALG